MCESIQVGSQVPDFSLNTYDPKTGDFGEVSLENLKSNGKWTILFFYPADFTFVCASEVPGFSTLYSLIIRMVLNKINCR